MRVLTLALLLSCRSEETTVVDTAPLRSLTEVEQLAVSWCGLISCRDGFSALYDDVDSCVGAYLLFWTDDSLKHNAVSCFTDLDEVAACGEALEAADCGGETPEPCTDLIACQNASFPSSDRRGRQ
jgi:hypothetical protein